ncbi:MAG: exosortase/archaeosortase family protein [Proteobacteria bacterium]|nr:exosortase/archaeosortase family protein [Pseudomonadota bacterium]MBU1059298.1 exosortase/archaeosortase family protein [Pseudomonadota bacterium]
MNYSTSFNRQTFVSLGIMLTALGFVYFPILQDLAKDWNTNDNYSHGYFIPVLSFYMIYTSREELKNLSVQTNFAGLFLLIAGLGQLIIAQAGSEFFLQRTSLIPVLAGLVLFCLGFAFLKKVLLPILYLIFMVPLPAIIWNKIAFPMQLFSSYLTEKVVTFSGIPIFREGNILHLSGTTLEVVDACSGLRSLTTLFALSAVFAILSSHTSWQKWVLFLAAAPIAIFANIIRLSATALLASKYGPDVAHGFLHDFSGLVVFAVGITLLVVVSNVLKKC